MTPTTKLKDDYLFDPLSTTPATSLTAPLPPDLDADVLVIGGKDVRNILYTAYSEVGPGPYPSSSEDGKTASHGHWQRNGNSLQERKIDITHTHHDPYIVARNVFALTFILDLNGHGQAGPSDLEEHGHTTKQHLADLFDIYHARFLADPVTRHLLALHSAKLCEVAQTLEDWESGPYGETIQFVNSKSLEEVRGVWGQYAEAAAASLTTDSEEEDKKEMMDKGKVAELHEAMAEGMRLDQEQGPDAKADDEYRWGGSVLGSAAAPLTMLLKDKIRRRARWAWENDRMIAEQRQQQQMEEGKMVVGNPTLACGILPLPPSSESGSEKADSEEAASSASARNSNRRRRRRRLAYPSNGVLGYHLALAKAPLTELSPLRPSAKNKDENSYTADDDDDFDDDEDEADGNPTIYDAAKQQFAEWALAFRELASLTLSGETQNKTRLTIRFAVDGWFTACQSLVKDGRVFDVIDTTDLSRATFGSPTAAGVADPPGGLGLMVAAKKLLRDRPSSTLVMDDGEGKSLLTGPGDNGDGDRSDQDKEAITASFILGLSSVEYWTNASVRATVDECLAAASQKYDEDVDAAGAGGGGGGRQDTMSVEEEKKAAAARVKKLEEEGGLKISNRLWWQHSRWLSPGPNGAVRKPVVKADAKELAEAAWRAYHNQVILEVEGQGVVHQGQEPVKVSWGQGVWQTLLDFLGVVCGQFETDREEFRQLILEKIGGSDVQDGLLKETLEKGEVSTTEAQDADGHPVFTASFDVTSGTLKTVTGHLDFIADEDKRVLADRSVPISLKQSSPWTIDIVLGSGAKKLVKSLVFPTPVLGKGSKTRIARTSGYIEVIAPAILDRRSAIAAGVLDGYIFPTVLQPVDADASASSSQLIPVPLNCPAVNLDSLPILSISDTSRLTFLSTLASSIFSPRELRVRNAAMEQGLPESDWGSARLTLKESLHTMLIIAAGLQVGQTGLFALSGSGSSSSDGRHILIFVSAIRLDCSAQSGGGIVIDAAVLPITRDLLATKKPTNTDAAKTEEEEDIHSFLILLRTLECVDLTITDAELALWKSLLPSFAERCRGSSSGSTYSHSPTCEYLTTGHIPLSLKKGDPILCTCGLGRFPPSYLPLPLWDTVASRYSTRVAISLPYCSPSAEKVVFDPLLAKKIAERGLEDALMVKTEERCRYCGKGEEELVNELKAKGGETATAGCGKDKDKDKDGVEVLRRCGRCLKVRYCSMECQRRDWKNHRGECVESERHGE